MNTIYKLETLFALSGFATQQFKCPWNFATCNIFLLHTEKSLQLLIPSTFSDAHGIQ